MFGALVLMTSSSHEALVSARFGQAADAYVKSAVHSEGADLDWVADLAKGAVRPRVLDLGCGGGHVSFRVAPHATDVTAYDLSADMLAAAAREAARRGLGNIRFSEGSVVRLPFAAASFDLVFSRYSAHHWEDLPAALREARRVLKPGGTALFVDAISPGVPLLDTFLQAAELLRDPSHVRDYALHEWQDALAGAGFAVKNIRVWPVRLDFSAWTKRMNTPQPAIEAILYLQRLMPDLVRSYFALETEGSFTISAAAMEVVPLV